MPCTEIQADWGAQRIKDLSLFRAVWEATEAEAVAGPTRAGQAGHEPDRRVQLSEVRPRHDVGALRRDRHRARDEGRHELGRRPHRHAGRTRRLGDRGHRRRPHRLRLLATSSRRCRSASSCGAWTRPCRPTSSPRPNDLRYRAPHHRRARGARGATSFPDNWIYINDPNVKVGRIQNFGRWSPYLVKDGRTCLGLELFVDEGDEWWNMSDAELIENGKRELAGDRAARPGRRRSRLRGADAEGVSVLRRATTRTTWRARRVARRARGQRVSGRTQRHAPLQQPGPLDADRDAVGREHLRRAPRHLVGQRRSRVPRGAQRRRGRRRRLRSFVVTCQRGRRVD